RPVRPRSDRRLIDRGDAPRVTVAGAAGTLDMSDRAIVDGEGECDLRGEIERLGDRAAYRAAMGDGDDIAPGIALLEAANRTAHPLEQVEEAFAAGRRHAHRSEPEAMIGLAEQRRQITVFLAMP